MDLKRLCVSICRVNGFTLNSEATKYLITRLSPVAADEREELLQRLIDALTKHSLDSPMLTRQILEESFDELIQYSSPDSDKIFNVIDAFSIPRFVYNVERKKLVRDTSILNVHGCADDKERLFRERYALLYQRTARHQLFLPPVLGASVEENEKRFQLKPVEYLLATTSRLGKVLVLGMLSQLKEGKFYLEDLSGAVPLDLTETKFHAGLITENCFVLAEGAYDDGIFHVEALGFPPAENAETSRTYFGNDNFFGGPCPTSVKSCPQLVTVERENEDAIFVILSDVWLNEIKVQQKLRLLLSGFADTPPTCFVFIGNFLSVAADSNSAKLLKDSFKILCNSILEHPTIAKQSKFIFVPGPRDLGLGNILPRPPIPTCLTNDFCRKIPTAIFTTNPCRIQFCTQEIVIFREDIVTKLCRSAIYFPTTGDIPNHFAKTVISQSHLCPLPLYNSPIYWSYDYALRLYPLPDVIICADKFNSYSVSNMDCTIFNPGSFSTNNFNFKVYMAGSKEVEDSQIPDE